MPKISQNYEYIPQIFSAILTAAKYPVSNLLNTSFVTRRGQMSSSAASTETQGTRRCRAKLSQKPFVGRGCCNGHQQRTFPVSDILYRLVNLVDTENPVRHCICRLLLIAAQSHRMEAGSRLGWKKIKTVAKPR